MNKYTHFPCIVMTCGVLLHAEAQQAPEPTGPCIKNAPAVSEWKVTFSKRKITSREGASQETAPLDLKEIDVTKANTTRHEIIFTHAGQTTDRWFHSGMVLCLNAGNPTVFVFDTRDENIAQMFPCYSESDFPELSWVTSSCYAGVQKLGTVACYYYAEPGGSKQAWIDQTTGLPMAYSSGSTVQSYAFHEASTRKLELPIQFQKALNDFTTARRLSQHKAKYN